MPPHRRCPQAVHHQAVLEQDRENVDTVEEEQGHIRVEGDVETFVPAAAAAAAVE